ncbi:hypothetical protein [Chondromyces apiculatus]|uniref:Uncharacterized protein n=1 Tax=Chondromyces apiculatus DSM 436 TaxID=1192034 RepID=A0A017SY86_9BACT|nr:hypothetical protein [Chondromyces apiculatus]EYF01737.1 Hypothetical protein CAP_7803 [Chondromyces apiculatus DSM 436]
MRPPVQSAGKLSIAGLFFLRILGCHADDPASSVSSTRPTTLQSTAEPGADLTIAVAEVRADPGIDPAAIGVALRDADAALRWCVEPDRSTGIIALRLSLERDGAVRDLRLLDATTYGSDEARGCFMRILGAMRFSSSLAAQANVDVTLEIRSRPRPLSLPGGRDSTPRK